MDEEGEEEEPMEEDDEVELLLFESSFLRECAKCHARSYLCKGGCCNPMCDTVGVFNTFSTHQSFSISILSSFYFSHTYKVIPLTRRHFVSFFCQARPATNNMDLFFLCPASKKLYYVHVREWQYHVKGKKQSKSCEGDREGMVKMIKQARAWAAQKAAAKPGAKKVKQNPNRSKGKSRKIWWQQRARSGMASSSRPTGTQYATVPHDPCPIQYLGDYMRSPFFVVSFFVTSPLWYLPPEAYARRRPGGGFRVPAAFSRASAPAAFTQGSGPEAVAGPSRNLMRNVGNWHCVVDQRHVGQGACS